MAREKQHPELNAAGCTGGIFKINYNFRYPLTLHGLYPFQYLLDAFYFTTTRARIANGMPGDLNFTVDFMSGIYNAFQILIFRILLYAMLSFNDYISFCSRTNVAECKSLRDSFPTYTLFVYTKTKFNIRIKLFFKKSKFTIFPFDQGVPSNKMPLFKGALFDV